MSLTRRGVGIDRLSIPERILLVGAIRDRIAGSPDEVSGDFRFLTSGGNRWLQMESNPRTTNRTGVLCLRHLYLTSSRNRTVRLVPKQA